VWNGHAFFCVSLNQVARLLLVWTGYDEAYGYDLDPTANANRLHSHTSRDRFGKLASDSENQEH
jgi:hypothetical protein